MGHTFLKIRLVMMFAPALAGVLWMGWSGGAKHYERPPTEVIASLKAAYVPTHVLGSYVKGSRVSQPDGETVVTALLDEKGNELMRFVTTVVADGTGSSVATEVEAPQGENAERAEEAMRTQGFAMSLLEMVAEEHVASAIEQRPFNMLAMNPAANAMIGAMPGEAEEIEDINRSAVEMSQWEQEQYASQASGGGATGDDWGSDSTDYGNDWGRSN